MFHNSNENHGQQVNTITKALFYDLSDDELYDILDNFWSKYNNFNNKNDLFDNDECIRSCKDIPDGNSHMWYRK